MVRDEVKELIRFRCLNIDKLINGEAISEMTAGFDIIFCRNVMIYFSAASQQELVGSLYRALVPGGYLFTGDAEPLHLYDHNFTVIQDAGCLVYKKNGDLQ